MRRLTLRIFLMLTVSTVALGVFAVTALFSAALYGNILQRQAEQNSSAIAQQTFESMFQVMRLGWGREELSEFTGALESTYEKSPTKVKIYRGPLVDELYGTIEEDTSPDSAVERAFSEGETLQVRDEGPLLRHIMPVTTRAECQDCHSNVEPGDVLGVIEVRQDIASVLAQARTGYLWLLLAGAPLALLVAAGVGYFTHRRLKRAVDEFGAQVAQVNAVKDIHRIEPRKLDLGFRDLNGVMDRVDDLIRRLKAIAVDKDILRTHQDRLEREQERAERIVARALSSAALKSPGVRYFYRPAAILSGDLLLAERRPNGNLLVLIGDFTGHGIGAAVGVPAVAEAFYERVVRGVHPAELLDLINERLYRNLPPDMFLTAALIEIDCRNRRLGAWNAGMPPLWLVQEGQIFATFDSGDLPLGVIGNSAPGRRQLRYQELPPNSYLYACSDGVVEAAIEGRMYGAEGVETALRTAPPGEGFDLILKHLERYWASTEPNDDTTLLELDLERITAAFCSSPSPAASSVAPSGIWRAELRLDATTLKRINPVPAVMELLGELGTVEADRQSLYFIIAELFNNALEHGVLGLDSALKHDADGFERYYRERLAKLETLSAGEICIRIASTPAVSGSDTLLIEIEDSGPGFDYAPWLERQRSVAQEETSEKPAGRGIRLARQLADSVEFFPPGNRVQVRYSGQK
ncbi:hypothetical protein CKO15_00395 [Halorhodospira abdelmalekii]|uniref:ATP-binding SpoIIE family protein phosphatase n=1 Tax=Halorhodospira abdelmalekii TaxID=421629 RepID=UPI001907B317|nr:SpoIIE family protein phosphatase [Halorhodospira abdelmalekii]MBK1733765.1 hypothetical protein [Halorhodospira abdelmalekii]